MPDGKRPLYRRRFLHTFYFGSRQSIDQFHEAGVVRITNGGLATWLHPFGMLEPQVVVNLLPKLGIGADLVRHGYVKVLLAFFGFSPMRSHFWPFTEVVRKIPREVTRKVGKIADDPPSRSSYREQAAAFTDGYPMVNDPAIMLSTNPARFTTDGGL